MVAQAIALPVARPTDVDVTVRVDLPPIDDESPLLRHDPRCMLFLEEWMRRPNWTLTFVQHHGDMSDDHFTLDATGRGTWTRHREAPR